MGPPTDVGINSLPLHTLVFHSINDKEDTALFSVLVLEYTGTRQVSLPPSE